MLKLGIRVSSTSSSGRGHFERCLAIRSHLTEKVFWFIDHESEYVKNKIYKTDELFFEDGKDKYNNLKNNLKNNFINCILLDNYFIDSKNINKICNNIPLLVFMDEYKNIEADVLICSQPISFSSIRGVKYLIGPKYAPISKKFLINKNKINNKILIAFGAYDSKGLTLTVIRSIKKIIVDSSYDLNIVITLTRDSPIIDQVKREIKDFYNFELVLDTKKMEDIYQSCNIAIGAPGLSYLERMASGIPSILISQNNIQSNLIDKWVELGCGIRAENCIKSIENALKKLIVNDNIRQELILKGKKIIDGKGAERIAKEIINMVSIK